MATTLNCNWPLLSLVAATGPAVTRIATNLQIHTTDDLFPGQWRTFPLTTVILEKAADLTPMSQTITILGTTNLLDYPGQWRTFPFITVIPENAAD